MGVCWCVLKSLLWVLTMCGCGTVCVFLFPPPKNRLFSFLFLFSNDALVPTAKRNPPNTGQRVPYMHSIAALSQHLYSESSMCFVLFLSLSTKKQKKQKQKTSICHLCASRTTQKSAGLQTTNHTEGLQVLYPFPTLLQTKSADEATMIILSIYEHA